MKAKKIWDPPRGIPLKGVHNLCKSVLSSWSVSRCLHGIGKKGPVALQALGLVFLGPARLVVVVVVVEAGLILRIT